MREVDLSIVTFRPDRALLQQLLASLAEPTAAPIRRHLFIHDNSPETGTTQDIEALARGVSSGAFDRIEVRHSGENVGYGRGHNANAALGKSRYFFALNQDCVPEPGVLEGLLAHAEGDDVKVGVWELRQIPYEH